MTTVRIVAGMQLLCAVGALLGAVLVAGEPPAEEVSRQPSTYAPAKDLESQVQFFLDRIKDDLKDESAYEDDTVKRVSRDANTLAVLALVLGKHDEANRYQASAATLLNGSLALAEKSQDYQAARSAYAQLVESLNGPHGAQDLAWKSVGNIVDLMHQVPSLNTKLRGQVRSAERFSKSPDVAAGLAATLAAISQVAMFDNSYCADQADQASWVELCGLMRDAARDVNQAVRSGDRDSAVENLKPLTRTCDDCHAQFKD